MEEAAEEIKLEYTPTWVVALVCSIIVAISLALRGSFTILARSSHNLKRKNQKPLRGPSEGQGRSGSSTTPVLIELMVLGFISLLLTVFQGAIHKICIPESLTRHMLPCKRETNMCGINLINSKGHE
ncbi:MLO-like protein 1 [Acorus calamus]|uniref:MLO-like protein 1 n=1 Tax=Acorus calamus TaxID=4465 RepID=A0AAV9FHN4_ACOCL|nr:MLO-like protein 1 [Acorus calamus]